MKFLDLTREISESSPVYPGDPPVLLTAEAEMERDGVRLRNLSFSSHQGTHVDAPAHVFSGGAYLDAFPLEVFSGPARVLKLGKVRPRTAITREMLEMFDEVFRECPRVLFSASWEGRQFEDAPFFTREAAVWLTRQEHLLLLGFDWPSPDAFDDVDLPIHRCLLSERVLFIENLTNLERLPREFRLTAFPLSLHEAEGAPVRAVAEFE
ncbi:MAG: cyclase family protein [Planctomycetaceae bacterium]|nr:cyclase family protein [Planctomycetaceae bacterium]